MVMLPVLLTAALMLMASPEEARRFCPTMLVVPQPEMAVPTVSPIELAADEL